MKLKISATSATPIYQQIMQQIQMLIGSRRLRAGDELPSIRNLASDLLVNPNTVARAYRELESCGVVYMRGTAGTFVAEQADALSERKRNDALLQQVAELMSNARELGFSPEDVIAAVDECSRVRK